MHTAPVRCDFGIVGMRVTTGTFVGVVEGVIVGAYTGVSKYSGMIDAGVGELVSTGTVSGGDTTLPLNIDFSASGAATISALPLLEGYGVRVGTISTAGIVGIVPGATPDLLPESVCGV